jgi:hypothetical protein
MSQLLRGHTTIHLAGTRPFSAGGLAGTVASTVSLALGKASTARLRLHLRRPPRPPNVRFLTVAYRVIGVRGRIHLRLHGNRTSNACLPLSVCATSGTITVEPRLLRGGQANIEVFGSARRPYRDFLAAAGLSAKGNRRGLQIWGAASWPESGQTRAVVAQPHRCRDDVGLDESYLSIQPNGRRIRLGYAPQARSFDPLRTRCPGPRLGRLALARGWAYRSVLRKSDIALHLTEAVHTTRGAFTVSGRADLVITLKRTQVSQQEYYLAPVSIPADARSASSPAIHKRPTERLAHIGEDARVGFAQLVEHDR